MIAMDYLGRLDAVRRNPNLKALLGGQAAAKITPNDLKSEAVRCGSEFKEKGDQLAAISRRHFEREKKQELEKNQERQRARRPAGHPALPVVHGHLLFSIRNCRSSGLS